jgi:hypothetical protein
VLWDCVTLFDDTTAMLIQALGGIRAMAVSHPHFYSSMVEWARAFDAPVHLHAADRRWAEAAPVGGIGARRAVLRLRLPSWSRT